MKHRPLGAGRHQRLPSRRIGGGFTMIEWMVTALVAILVMLGVVTGLRGFQARKQIEGLAQNLASDLNLARSAATGSAQSVQLNTTGDGRGWRLVRCDAAAGCSAGTDVFKAVNLPTGVSITANRSFEFRAPRGVVQSTNPVACLAAGSTVTALKVGIDNTLGSPTVCAIGASVGTIPACTSGC